MSLIDALKQHHELCTEAYDLLREENQAYKKGPGTPDETLMKQKRLLFSRLEASVDKLREFREMGGIKTREDRQLMQDTQNLLMKIFLLDRENEQALLKASAGPRPAPPPPKPRPGAVKAAYAAS